MAKTVIGVFEARDKAEQAVAEMRKSGGFRSNEISIVKRDGAAPGGGTGNIWDNQEDVSGMSNISDGTTTGGVLGGLTGLAAGAGALVVPGIGPLLAAGPIAGLLSGTAAGGIAGGLIDWGIPEDRGRHYEEEIKKGGTLVTVNSRDDQVQDAADIMRDYGAHDVETH